jgi:hypothetical protein
MYIKVVVLYSNQISMIDNSIVFHYRDVIKRPLKIDCKSVLFLLFYSLYIYLYGKFTGTFVYIFVLRIKQNIIY